MVSSAPSVGGIAARHRDEQDEAEDDGCDTDVYMPTAAMRDASCVSSAVCADASKPVIVYWAISRPSPNTNQNAGFDQEVVPVAVAGRVDRLGEDVRERLVLVGDDDEHADDERHADHVPLGGDRVQPRRDPDVEQVDQHRQRRGRSRT